MPRLTCAIVICPTDVHAARVRRLGVYLFRADGRTGSVRRGSPALSADLLALYVAKSTGDGRRRPDELRFDHLAAQGICLNRPLKTIPRAEFGRVPARRAFYEDLIGASPEAPFYCCRKHRKAAMTGSAVPKTDRLARTRGGLYFATVHTPLSASAEIPHPEVPESWLTWSRDALETWEQDIRDDEYGEPIVRCLPEDVSDDIRRAFGTRFDISPLHLAS